MMYIDVLYIFVRYPKGQRRPKAANSSQHVSQHVVFHATVSNTRHRAERKVGGIDRHQHNDTGLTWFNPYKPYTRNDCHADSLVQLLMPTHAPACDHPCPCMRNLFVDQCDVSCPPLPASCAWPLQATEL